MSDAELDARIEYLRLYGPTAETLPLYEEIQRLRVAVSPTRENLTKLGIPFPPPKGWRKRLLTHT